MKNLILTLTLLVSLAHCDDVELQNGRHEVDFVVYGTSSMIRVDGDYYTGLNQNIEYEKRQITTRDDVTNKGRIVLHYDIEKLTNDNALVGYEIFVDGNIVQTAESTAPLAKFDIVYYIEY